MTDVFLRILGMSVTAGWVIMAVIVLRFFLRRAPKWLRCLLWAIVAVRLVCPFSIESTFSLMPGAEAINPAMLQYAPAPAAASGDPAADALPVSVTGDFAAPGPEERVDSVQTWIFAGSIVWVSGLVILLGYALFSSLRLRLRMAEAVLLYGNVYICDAAVSPFVLGLARPRIYLPSDLEDTQLKYVLAHECAHLRRKDHWWKTFGYILLAVYWFHPLVWAAYILLCRDIEFACDEKVVRSLNMAGRKAYSKALVTCSMKRRRVMVCPLAFGETDVKRRVITVLNYSKPAFWLILVAVTACVAAAVCFLTDPRKDKDLAEMIDAGKEALTEQIGTMISEAEAVRYEITDWELIVEQTDGDRADCYFGANWIATRKPEDDPMIQGMYQTANSLPDEAQRALALETADGWLAEMRSWPGEEYLEHPIVIMLEGREMALYYPYVTDGEETLIPLQEFLAAEWTEDSEKRYQDGVRIIEEAVSTASLNGPASDVLGTGGTADDASPSGRASDAPEAGGAANAVSPSDGAAGNVSDSGGTAGNGTSSGGAGHDAGEPDTPAPGGQDSGTQGTGRAEGQIREGINHYRVIKFNSDSMVVDEIEWVTDSGRAAELGLDETLPGGYALYNEAEDQVECLYAENCTFTILDWNDNRFNPVQISRQAFLDIMAERESVYNTWEDVVYILEIADGKIAGVTEQYQQ